MPPIVALETPTAGAATTLFWPRATLLPVTPALTDAPDPRTVEPATPWSLAPTPPTREPAPVAEGAAPPPALSDTTPPLAPATSAPMAWSAAYSSEPLTASVLVALY
jgi:hypothetical protein